jgi:hypothetical protein
MRLLFALAVLAAAAAAATSVESAPAAPAPHVIHSDRNAGGILIARTKPAAVIRRFGRPASRKAEGPGCLMYWPKVKLAIRFLDFEQKPCTNGVAAVVTITSRVHWRTAVGLRVGDRVARLWRLYPRASFQRGTFTPFAGYWLVTRRACAEVGGAPYPGLLARARNGRVSAFVVSTTACE